MAIPTLRMAQQIPINPALLIWARKRAGVSRDEAVQKFKRLADWELGQSAPTYAQLEQLSDTFKVPIAVFFFPEPPDVPSMNETFRTLPEAELDQLPSRIRLLMRKAKAMQLNLVELTGGQNRADGLITRDLHFLPNVDIGDMATAVRNYIGVSVEDQQNWRDDETALKEWRSALLRGGIFVFKEGFRVENFSGFCLYDDEFPIIGSLRAKIPRCCVPRFPKPCAAIWMQRRRRLVRVSGSRSSASAHGLTVEKAQNSAIFHQ